MDRNQLCVKQNDLFITLCKFDEFCKRENIKYFICAGTLLGAVKYQDFIPWDDDLDVYILRSDFNKMLDRISNLNGYDLKLVKVFFNDRIVSTTLGRNNFIDISVLDSAPTGWLSAKLITAAQLIMRACLYDRIILNQKGLYNKSLFLVRVLISRIIRLCVSKKNIYRFQTWLCCYFNAENSSFLYLGSSDSRYLKTVFPTEWFDQSEHYKFRNSYFPSMKFPGDYLEQQYGDISIDPPLELQVPQHSGLNSFIYDFYSESIK